MALPLQGVRILAVSQFGAGPFATMVLADLGAEVIKIEDPTSGGDVARSVPPYHLPEAHDSLYFQSFNRNKKSLALNLQAPEGKAIFHDLVRISDAVYNNLRGDLPRKLGLDYEALKAINSRVVCCSLSGFGTTGPRADEPGYDNLIQAYAGFMSLTGGPEDPPTKCGVSIIDFAGGYVSVLGLMIALFAAQRTGKGCDVDVSLLDVATALLSYFATWHLNRGYTPERLPDSAHATLVPAQNFPTKDGYIVVVCYKEKFWERLCELLGRPELASDARFRRFSDRLANRDVLIPILKETFRQKTTQQWLSLLRGQVPCAPVNSLEEALRDPQVLARGMIVNVPHPLFGPIKEVNCPIHISGAEMAYAPGPRMGEHTEEILKAYLGMPAERISELERKGIVVCAPQQAPMG